MRTTSPCSRSRAQAKTQTELHPAYSNSSSLASSVWYCSGFSSSLAPPPLDDDLALNERLAQVKTCLAQPSADPRARVLISYDIIQAYKVLVLSCGISLEGSCEDPKVGEIILSFGNDSRFDHFTPKMFIIIIT